MKWGLFTLLCIACLLAVLAVIWAYEMSKPPLVTHWHDAKAVPAIFQEKWESLKTANARDFRPILLDNERCYNEFLDDRQRRAFDQLVPLSYKSDLCRYAFLYKRGGLYTDIKFSADAPLKEVYDKQLLVADMIKPDILNGFLTARPGDPLMKRALDKAVENIEQRRYGETPLDVTGPKMLGGVATEEDFARTKDLSFRKAGEAGNEIVDLSGRRIASTARADGKAEGHMWHNAMSSQPPYSVLWDERKVFVDAQVK
jgi:hypothetical protein